MKSHRGIGKSLAKYVLSAFAGAVLTQAFDIQLWPFLQIQYDKVTKNSPDPSITILVWEPIENTMPRDYVNRCADFQEFLIKSKLAFKLPSDMYFAQTVEQPKDVPYCAVSAPFPQYIHKRNEAFYDYPTVPSAVRVDNCSDSKRVSVVVGNSGKRKVDYLRARVLLNENYFVTSTGGGIVEDRGSHSFVVYRENIVGLDTISDAVSISNPSGAKIDPNLFIEKMRVSYGWRGMEKELDKSKINVLYALAIKNCKANCKNMNIDSFSISKWDGF